MKKFLFEARLTHQLVVQNILLLIKPENSIFN